MAKAKDISMAKAVEISMSTALEISMATTNLLTCDGLHTMYCNVQRLAVHKKVRH
jgi:hypothetical protein